MWLMSHFMSRTLLVQCRVQTSRRSRASDFAMYTLIIDRIRCWGNSVYPIIALFTLPGLSTDDHRPESRALASESYRWGIRSYLGKQKATRISKYRQISECKLNKDHISFPVKTNWPRMIPSNSVACLMQECKRIYFCFVFRFPLWLYAGGADRTSFWWITA